MSSVVLRCPQCGTTGVTPGECEACHDAQLRYFCTNHKPGRWLEAPACPGCGARFGVAAGRASPPAGAERAPARPPAASPPPLHPRPTVRDPGRSAEPPPAPAARPRRLPEMRRPPGSDRGEAAPDRGWRPDRGGRHSHEPEEALHPLEELMRITEGHRRRESNPDEPAVPPLAPMVLPIARGLGGCLGRLVMLAVVVVLGLLALLFTFGGAFLSMFGFY